MKKLSPHLEILPAAQRQLWNEFDQIPGGVKIASLLDLAGTKAAVVQVRPEAKDYIDLDVLISSGGVSLSMALTAAQKLYGASFNPQITLKALSYFEDGDLKSLPEDTKARLAGVAREVDLDRLPALDDLIGDRSQEYGLDV